MDLKKVNRKSFLYLIMGLFFIFCIVSIFLYIEKPTNSWALPFLGTIYILTTIVCSTIYRKYYIRNVENQKILNLVSFLTFILIVAIIIKMFYLYDLSLELSLMWRLALICGITATSLTFEREYIDIIVNKIKK